MIVFRSISLDKCLPHFDLIYLYIIFFGMENIKAEANQVYFKEYSCYQFKFTKQVDDDENGDRSFSFVESNNVDVDVLPSLLIDKMSKKQMLYILDYKSQNGSELLFIKQLSDEKWKLIKMNLLPQFITISGGIIYMVAGSNLAICSIYEQYKQIRSLSQGKIISVDACVVQFEANKRQDYQPGISITYFTESQGYFFKQYSKSNKVRQENISRIVNIILFKKFMQFRHFYIIVPNIIALVFLSDSEFCLFNIQTGMIQQQIKTKLMYNKLSEQRPVIKWKQHTKLDNFNKSLIIAIGVSQGIQIFLLNINYLSHFEQQLVETRLQDVHYGNFIDWDRTIVETYLYLHVSARIIDLAISKKGIAYYSKNDVNSQVGNCSYVDFKSSFIETAILTQQANVWRTYYEDKDLDTLTDRNRFYIPNRYPLELVKQQFQVGHFNQLQSILLNEWRSHYKFKHLIIFNQEIIIGRAGSLGVFRGTLKELFEFQYFSQQKIILLDHLEKKQSKINNQVESVFKKNSVEYQQSIFHGFIDRPLLQQRSYKKVYESDAYQPQQYQKDIQSKYLKMVKQFEGMNKEDINEMYCTLNINEFRLRLTCSQLYDYINYYHLILNSKKSKVGLDGIQQKNKRYEIYMCVAKLINYFYQLLQRAELQHKYFGNNLIALFIQSNADKLTSDIDASVYSFLKLILLSLFPLNMDYEKSLIHTQQSLNQQISKNSFLQFLIKKLMKQIDAQGFKQESKQSRYLRDQLSNVLAIGFFDIQSNSFAHFWNNTSLFKSILLCSDQSKIKYFCQFLLRKGSSRFLPIYKQIRKYIRSSHIIAIQNILLFNLKFHELQPDIFYITQSQSPIRHNHSQRSTLASHTDTINSIKKDIYNENLLNWDGKKGDLSQQILQQIEELGVVKEYNEQQFINIKAKLNMVAFGRDEQQLQFQEKLIAAYIQLFNSRVSIEGWQPNYQSIGPDQAAQLTEKKTQLFSYLNQIESHLNSYKNLYIKIYEENCQSNQERQSQANEIERRYNFQLTLLTKRFVDNPQKFSFFEQGSGLLCSSISIALIRQALYEIYAQSLQVRQDLVCFWLNWINEEFRQASETLLYFETVFVFDKSAVQRYLQINNTLLDRMQRIYSRLRHQANYEFFELFKEQKTQ